MKALPAILLFLFITKASEAYATPIREEYFIGEEIVFSADKSIVLARKQVAHKTIYDQDNALVHDIAHFPSEPRVFSMSYKIPNNTQVIETSVISPTLGVTGRVSFYGARWAWYGFTVKMQIQGIGSMHIFGHYYPKGGFFASKEIYSTQGKLISINETEYLRVSKRSFDKVLDAY